MVAHRQAARIARSFSGATVGSKVQLLFTDREPTKSAVCVEKKVLYRSGCWSAVLAQTLADVPLAVSLMSVVPACIDEYAGRISGYAADIAKFSITSL